MQGPLKGHHEKGRVSPSFPAYRTKTSSGAFPRGFSRPPGGTDARGLRGPGGGPFFDLGGAGPKCRGVAGDELAGGTFPPTNMEPEKGYR